MRVRWLPSGLAVLLVAACARVEPVSSSRLVPLWVVGDGGRIPRYPSEVDGEVYAGPLLYDALLRTACQVAPSADGARRCFPVTTAPVRFSDPTCTERIVEGAGASPPAGYALEFERCAGIARTFQVRGALPKGPVYEQSASGCKPSYREGVEQDRFPLEEVPLARFVALREETLPAGGRLHARDWITDDGLRLRVGASDPALGARCRASWEARSRECVCLPVQEDLTDAVSFTDAACTRPRVYDARCAPAPAVRYDPAGADRCGPLRYAPLGDAVPAATEYEVDLRSGACGPTRDSPGFPRFDTGPAVPLPPLMPRLEGPEDARLRPYVMDDGHGLVLPTGRFQDARLGLDCAPAFQGPALVCRPTDRGWYPDDLYVDAACTTRIELAAVGAGDCGAPRRVVHQLVDGGVAFRPLGAPFTDPLFEFDVKLGCIPYNRAPQVTLVRVGPAERVVPLAPLTVSDAP